MSANIPRGDYLDAIEGVCRFTARQQDARGAVIDPFLLREHRDHVPAEKMALWRRRLVIPREQVVRGGLDNWRTYAMKGEWLRWKAGLLDHDQAVAFVEAAWLHAEQRARIAGDKWNCYQDHTTDPEPHAVAALSVVEAPGKFGDGVRPLASGDHGQGDQGQNTGQLMAQPLGLSRIGHL